MSANALIHNLNLCKKFIFKKVFRIFLNTQLIIHLHRKSAD